MYLVMVIHVVKGDAQFVLTLVMNSSSDTCTGAIGVLFCCFVLCRLSELDKVNAISTNSFESHTTEQVGEKRSFVGLKRK